MKNRLELIYRKLIKYIFSEYIHDCCYNFNLFFRFRFVAYLAVVDEILYHCFKIKGKIFFFFQIFS